MMEDEKATPLDILVEILADPATWTRIGLAITGAGFAVIPDWWKWVALFGLGFCPLIAQILTEVQRRQKRAEKTVVAALVQEKKDNA